MSKARSYKNEPWLSFQKQSYSVLKDDFPHEKVLTVKANISSANGGLNLKESLSQKGDSLSSTGQTKLWFYLRNQYSVYTKILPNALTLAYDHGVIERSGKSFNWYGGLDTTRSLHNNVWRLGLDCFDGTGNWTFNNQLEVNQNDKSLVWLHKSYLTRNNWFFNRIHAVDLTNKACKTSGVLISHKQTGEKYNTDCSARFDICGFSLTSFDEFKRSIWEGNRVTLNWVRWTKGKCSHGLEFSSKLNELVASPLSHFKNLSTAVEVNLPESNSTAKFRLSGNWSAAISLKHKLGNYGSYIWGAEISELGHKNNIKFGVQIDLNI